MSNPILVTGGSGKTGSRVVAELQRRGFEPRIAQRSPSVAGAVHFDWLDSSTYEAALQGFNAIYLVAPPNVSDVLGAMKLFINLGLESGVQRFVLLSASVLEEGGPMMGEVHAYLKANAPHWTALRPSWFMQNFSEQQHLPTIRDENAIYSATGDGKVPFIDAADIAAVAAEALINDSMPSGDLILTGPQALSYDEVAVSLSKELGREITHKRLTETQLAQRFETIGMPPKYATVLAAMDTSIAIGSEDRVTDNVPQVTGRKATDFETFAHQVRNVWL